MFDFLSETPFILLPSGRLLLILQNLAQTSLPPGDSLASLPSKLITPLSTRQDCIFAVISFVFL